MPTYSYKFDLTSSNVSLSSTDTVSNDGYDLSEFNGDPRGTPRVADWSDLSSMNEAEFDLFTKVLDIAPDSSFLASSVNNPVSINDYYWDTGAENRFFSITVCPRREVSYIDSNVITHSLYDFGSKNIIQDSVSSANMKVLVYFPNWEPNGGHQSITLTID